MDYTQGGVHDYSKSQSSLKKILWMIDSLMNEKKSFLSQPFRKERLKKESNQDILLVYEVWLFGTTKMRKSAKTTNKRYNELTKRVPQKIKEVLIAKFWENGQSSNYPQHLIMILYDRKLILKLDN